MSIDKEFRTTVKGIRKSGWVLRLPNEDMEMSATRAIVGKSFLDAVACEPMFVEFYESDGKAMSIGGMNNVRPGCTVKVRVKEANLTDLYKVWLSAANFLLCYRCDIKLSWPKIDFANDHYSLVSEVEKNS